jgi:AGCS family alanine or glycine:cation symporter
MLATFGIGNMVQSNSVAHALEGAFHVPVWITGLVLCIGTGIVILGGIKSIAKATGMIVPFMLIFFIIGSIISLIEFRDNILNAFYQVFYYAFSTPAAAGGFLGTTIAQTMRIGVARGIFSNEAGLGSSPIAAAAAKTANPVSQALVSMTQTFIDTIIGCTFTGIVIIASGVWTSGETGSRLASLAYESGTSPVIGSTIVSVSLAFFAYATLVGWSYFGEKAVEYLFKEGVVKPYRIAFTLAVFLGAVVKLEIVWAFADIMNGLMAFPNLVGLLGLSKVVVEETKKYLPGELARLRG